MGLFEFLTVAAALGCATSIATLAINMIGDSRRRAAEHRAAMGDARVAALEARIADLQVRGDELERQLDWSRRLFSEGGTVTDRDAPGAASKARSDD